MTDYKKVPNELPGVIFQAVRVVSRQGQDVHLPGRAYSRKGSAKAFLRTGGWVHFGYRGEPVIDRYVRMSSSWERLT